MPRAVVPPESVSRMITGKQIREARALLRLQRSKFAERAGVPHAVLKLAEMTDGECPVTLDRARQIRRAIEAAGLELYGEGEEAGVRRRPAPDPPAARRVDARVEGGLAMTKLPKKGDEVKWGTAGGETHGTVEKIVTSETKIKGHTAKATKEEPQVVVKSDKSGKEAVHKPEELKKG